MLNKSKFLLSMHHIAYFANIKQASRLGLKAARSHIKLKKGYN